MPGDHNDYHNNCFDDYDPAGHHDYNGSRYDHAYYRASDNDPGAGDNYHSCATGNDSPPCHDSGPGNHHHGVRGSSDDHYRAKHFFFTIVGARGSLLSGCGGSSHYRSGSGRHCRHFGR